MKQKNGFSLVELILACAAVFFVVLIMNNLPSSISSINKSRQSSRALEVANKKLESLRSLNYQNLPTGTVSFTDPTLNTLSSYNAYYQIDDCPETICPTAQNTKLAKVNITWQESGDTKVVELNTLISEGGLGQ